MALIAVHLHALLIGVCVYGTEVRQEQFRLYPAYGEETLEHRQTTLESFQCGLNCLQVECNSFLIEESGTDGTCFLSQHAGDLPGQHWAIRSTETDIPSVAMFSFTNAVVLPYETTWTGFGMNENIDTEDRLDSNTHFTCSQPGFYLLSLSVLMQYNFLHARVVEYNSGDTLFGIGNIADSYRESFGKSWLYSCREEDELGLEYKGQGNNGVAFRWSGWSMSNTMSPLVTFMLTKTNGWDIIGTVHFDVVESSQGVDGIDAGLSMYTIPYNGYYFFSYTTGTASGIGVALQLKRNNDVINQMVSTSTHLTGNSIITCSVMIPANKFDVIKLELVAGEMYSSAENREISLIGMYYHPRSPTPLAAWSLFRRTRQLNTGTTDDVEYDTILVKEQIDLIADSQVKILVAGYYHLSMNIGCFPNSQCLVYFFVNNDDPGAVNRWSEQYNGHGTLSTSIVEKLEVGELVTLRMLQGTDVFSNSNLVTGFTGFLIKKT